VLVSRPESILPRRLRYNVRLTGRSTSIALGMVFSVLAWDVALAGAFRGELLGIISSSISNIHSDHGTMPLTCCNAGRLSGLGCVDGAVALEVEQADREAEVG
jgi:hypothetical protein